MGRKTLEKWNEKDPSRWLPLDIDQADLSNKKELVDQLAKSLEEGSMDPEIARIVATEMLDTTTAAQNTVFIFTENDYVITGIHVPHEALGSDGPVLMRGADDRSIIAAFSRDKIIAMLDKLDLAEEETGLQSEDREVYEKMWIDELEELAQLVRLEMAVNPPETWGDLLKGGNPWD